MSDKRYIFQLRRGSSRAIESYEPILNEVIWVTDKKELWLWTGTHWSTLTGTFWFDLFRNCCLRSVHHGDNDTRYCIAFGGGVVPVAMVDDLYLQTIVLCKGEPVCNIDTHTVHIGDGVTTGGIPLTP